MTARLRSTARALLLPAAGVLAFEAWVRSRGVDSDTLAPPSAALRALVDALGDGSLLAGTAQTLVAMLAGLAIGVGLALPAGLAIGFSRRADALSFLVVEALRPIPSVALLPLAMMLFGFGYRMQIFVIAFATFWPFLILTQAAVKQVEPRLLEVARGLGLSPGATAWKIVLPAAAPRLMTAFRLAAGIALVVGVTCEIASNPQGLGHALMIAQETLRPARMFGFLLWVGSLGFALNLGLLALERWLFAHRGDYDPTVSS